MNGLENLISDLILQLLSYIEENKRKRIKGRQEEGIKISLNNGRKFGRKKILPKEIFKIVIDDWRQGKITAIKAMELVNMKSNTFYRRVKEYEST